MDKISAQRRSANMARIRSKNTSPEIILRCLIHRLGYRFRLHRKDLPGRPDIVFPSRRKIVLAHGCFWHQHPGCPEGRVPNSRREYWGPKLKRNEARVRNQPGAVAGARLGGPCNLGMRTQGYDPSQVKAQAVFGEALKCRSKNPWVCDDSRVMDSQAFTGPGECATDRSRALRAGSLVSAIQCASLCQQNPDPKRFYPRIASDEHSVFNV